MGRLVRLLEAWAVALVLGFDPRGLVAEVQGALNADHLGPIDTGPVGATTPEHLKIQEAWGLTDAEWDALCIPSETD